MSTSIISNRNLPSLDTISARVDQARAVLATLVMSSDGNGIQLSHSIVMSTVCAVQELLVQADRALIEA